MNKIIVRFKEALLDLDKIGLMAIVQECLKEMSAIDFANKIALPALEDMGKYWQDGNLALSQIYMSGKICEEIINSVLPPENPSRIRQPKMAITVLNDYHSLGKRLVYSHLRSSGYELLDYGRTSVDELTNKIKQDNIEIILISTLMYPSALSIKDVREKLNKIYPDVKIIVGGAPFNMDSELWKRVGADMMGYHAGEALDYIKEFKK